MILKKWILLTLLCMLAMPVPAKRKVLQEKDMSAYLLVFFNDPTHSIFFATSHDGYAFTAVNNAQPVIDGYDLAEQHGVRDPHIYRGPDGAFYMVATDLHVFGMQKGYRTTQWERDQKLYDWGNNRGIVLMKSKDLIHWTHTEVRIDKAFPKDFGELGCAWAPQTVWDTKKNKPMVYFTIRPTGRAKTKLYYAYANKAFTKLTTVPQLLFEYPDPNIQVLDADIIQMPDGRFCMTYVAQENPGGIKVAFSDEINRGYRYQEGQIDFEDRGCEAPNIWKRLGENKWVMMYDIYSLNPHNFGFAETTDFKTWKPLGRFNEGVMKTTNFETPKHGSVIHITAEEAKRIEEYWKNDAPKTDWKLVWSDEFNKDGALDTTVWNFEEGFRRNHEDQWYQRENAYCKDGCLVIEAQRTSRENPLYEEGSKDWRKARKTIDYTSASVNTARKKEFQYGRLEVKAKIPTAGGSWPAIWTLGKSMPWPSNGEIDVMEYYRIGGIPHILANAAWGDDRPNHAIWDAKRTPFEHFLKKDPQWAEKFHVWRFDWDKKHLAIYLDDEILNYVPIETIHNGKIGEGKNPFHQPHYLLLNLALGGDNGGKIDDSAFPMRYYIDYVRLYQ